MGERTGVEGVRSRKRGGAIVLAVVLLGAFAIGAFVWASGGDDARIPSKEQMTRPGGTRWLVTAESIPTSKGFEVVELTPADLRAEPRLEDLIEGGGRATLIVSGEELATVTAYLQTRLPEGWDDPYDYGIAWRYGTELVRLSLSEADVL